MISDRVSVQTMNTHPATFMLAQYRLCTLTRSLWCLGSVYPSVLPLKDYLL